MILVLKFEARPDIDVGIYRTAYCYEQVKLERLCRRIRQTLIASGNDRNSPGIVLAPLLVSLLYGDLRYPAYRAAPSARGHYVIGGEGMREMSVAGIRAYPAITQISSCARLSWDENTKDAGGVQHDDVLPLHAASAYNMKCCLSCYATEMIIRWKVCVNTAG